MANVELFNVLGGYSVGIPPKVAIDNSGNLVTNVNAPNSNVTANRVFANSYLYANGDPLSIGASGSNTQVQYNNNGLLGASSAFTFNSTTSLVTVSKLQVSNSANLGNVSNIIILGGNNGYFLQTDGEGNLTWAPGSGGNGGNGSPGGANSQVQFNDAGSFGGDAGFTYNKVSNTLSIANNIAAGNAITGVNLAVTDATIYNTLSVTDVIASNITLTANITSANWINSNYFAGNGHNLFGLVGANVTGQVGFAAVANSVAGANVTGQVAFANVANNVAGANVTGQVANALVAGTVYTNAQPNITSVGNLTSLTVVGNTTLGNQVVSNYFIGNLFGLANLARNVTYAAQPNITSVGTLTSLTVSGNTTLGNTVTANYFVGNLYGVANSAIIANTANLANNANRANLANAAVVAGTVTVNAQPNITTVGTLTALNVNGLSNLGSVSNITITGGSPNYVLSTDGVGNLSWVEQSSGNTVVPGGLNTYVQFNDGNTFGGDNAFTWNKTTNYLFVGGNANFAGMVNAQTLTSNVSTGTPPLQVISTTPVANLSVETANTVRGNIQPNITSVGNLTNLVVVGNIETSNLSVSNNFGVTGNLSCGNLSTPGSVNSTRLAVTGNANLNGSTVIGTTGNLIVNGTLNASNSANVNLGNVSNLHISGGLNGYVLTTDGAGNLSWSVGGSGGNGSPGGSNTQIQYNNNGIFDGSAFLTFNNTTNTLSVAGNLIANSFTMGSGVFQFSQSRVFAATTNTDIPNQTLIAIEADDLAAIDFTIISTSGNIRNFVKISAVVFDEQVNYVEYSNLPINGYIGDYQVVYDTGNVIVPATVKLLVSPNSANFTTHKMSITTYIS